MFSAAVLAAFADELTKLGANLLKNPASTAASRSLKQAVSVVKPPAQTAAPVKNVASVVSPTNI